MQVLINLEKDGIDDLRKAIEVLQTVIDNKDNGRHFSEGLDKFDAPSEPQETQATLDQVQESVQEVAPENNHEVNVEEHQEAPQEEHHHEHQEVPQEEHHEHQEVPQEEHQEHHEAPQAEHNPEPVQENPAEQPQQNSGPESVAAQKIKEQEKLMKEVDLSEMFLSKLTIKPIK